MRDSECVRGWVGGCQLLFLRNSVTHSIYTYIDLICTGKQGGREDVRKQEAAPQAQAARMEAHNNS